MPLLTTGAERVRRWLPAFPLDLPAVIGPLRRGAGDPAFRLDARGTHWLAGNTPAGAGTLALCLAGGEVSASAWGPGADWLLESVPALLGASDDDSDFMAHHPVIAASRRELPGLRLGASGRVWDVLLGAVLEQKVTNTEARRSWRELAWRFGEAAPGPAPDGMRVPPTPRVLVRLQDWEWHKAGVDGARRRTLVNAARVAHQLEKAVDLAGVEGRNRLRLVSGIGVWTAAEVAQRAWGDPDAVSFGDFHLAHIVGTALVGHRLDDEGMAEVLAPYAPQRHRAVRYIEAAGISAPRFGPRFSPRDYRRW
ncbi:MAG TPA: DNA-3-methyladenine glycosylase 2 family protein [Pseudonocardiaceae bacterium]